MLLTPTSIHRSPTGAGTDVGLTSYALKASEDRAVRLEQELQQSKEHVKKLEMQQDAGDFRLLFTVFHCVSPRGTDAKATDEGRRR